MSSSASATPSSDESAAVTAELQHLYGEPRLLAAPAVVHVVALWQPPAGEARVMHIGEATPQSPTDTLVLSLARARAEAIITTGRILRDEPTVRYRPFGPWAKALERWRREVVGLAVPPRVVVLSRQPLPDHPALADGAERFDGDLLAAVAALHAAGLTRITVEAGPSTARDLYLARSPLTQLMLSTCRAPTLPPAVVGPVLVPEATLRATLPHTTVPTLRLEGGQPWAFSLWHRRPGDF